MTPISILTGYLGAGKTTLLNRILHSDHGVRVAVLVNDFGAVNIDAQLIVGVEGEAVTLSNGCICCTIRNDLVEAVSRLLDREEPPEFILIEASGVSDPAQVVLTFNRSGLRSRVQIDSIMAVVDAEQILDIRGQPKDLVYDQVRVADIVILNKIDLVSEEQRAQARARVQQLVPKARILEATYADVPMNLILGVGSYNPQIAFMKPHGVHVHGVGEEHDHEHHDHSLVFNSWHWQCTSEPLSLQALRTALDELPQGIFRAKGFVHVQEVPDKKVLLQMVGKRVALTEGHPWGTQPPTTDIVMIGTPTSLDKTALEALFEGCRVSNQPESGLTQLVDGVLKWLRVRK